MNYLSVRKAILVGVIFINGPVILVIVGGFGLIYLNSHEWSELLIRALWFVPPTVAWPIWSLLVPHWRIWALANVEDKEHLTESAIKAGIIWPKGHFFEKTEIKTANMKRREKQLGWN